MINICSLVQYISWQQQYLVRLMSFLTVKDLVMMVTCILKLILQSATEIPQQNKDNSTSSHDRPSSLCCLLFAP